MIKHVIFVLFVFINVICRSQQSKPGDLPPLMSRLLNSKPDTARVSLFINIAEYYLGQARGVSPLDSVAFYLKKAHDLNQNFHIAVFENRISLYSAIRQSVLNPSVDPRVIFLPVIDTCKKTGDKLYEAQAWMWLGSTMGWDSLSLVYKLTCFQNSLVLARLVRDDFMDMMLQASIAVVHTQQLKFDLAEHELLLVLKEEKKEGPIGLLTTNVYLGNLYTAKGEYDKALRYTLKALELTGITGDSTNASNIFMRLSFIYEALGRRVESLEWARKSLDYDMATNIPGVFEKVDKIATRLRILGNPQEALDFIMGVINKKKPSEINDQRIVQRALGDTYNVLNKYDLAEKSYVEMIRLGDMQTDNFPVWDKGYDNAVMGNFYFRRGQYKKALTFLNMSLGHYEVYGQFPYLKRVHEMLFKTDSALGDYVGAIRHLKEYNLLGDSIFNIARNKQIEELQIAYQTEQKDKNFRMLKEKEKLAQIQLQHGQSTRNWIITGASLLLIIAILLYRQSLIRKRNNRVINVNNMQLQHLVAEKEWLLKEVHHRVKNNLQIVMSLLNSQSAYIDNDAALTAINDSRHRVHAMSLIHQKLYNLENVSSIDMSFYIRELVSYLSDTFDTGQRIRFEFDIDPLEMDVSQAVPLGLILNEAITNSIKYAFPGNRDGLINISLSNTASTQYLLTISDNGIGMPVNVTNKKPGSLGMSLMSGLSGDLDGSFIIENNKGTTIKISFVHDLSIKRPDMETSSFTTHN